MIRILINKINYHSEYSYYDLSIIVVVDGYDDNTQIV